MAEQSPATDQQACLADLLAKLEEALIEFVEKFGPTERAREALRLASVWHARADVAEVTADLTERPLVTQTPD